jgi:hypothetical protein
MREKKRLLIFNSWRFFDTTCPVASTKPFGEKEESNRAFNNAAPSQPGALLLVHWVSSLLRRYVMRYHEPLGPGERYAAGTVAGGHERERQREMWIIQVPRLTKRSTPSTCMVPRRHDWSTPLVTRFDQAKRSRAEDKSKQVQSG